MVATASARPTREEVLEGLRQLRLIGSYDIYPRLDATIAYLENLPTPEKVFRSFVEAGWRGPWVDWYEPQTLEDLEPADQAEFRAVLEDGKS